jgi:protein-tyrosine phosphatase
MVDIHAHILPEVDDGAEDLFEALEMAHMAADCGVTDLMATSHFRTEGDRARMQRQFRLLEEALGREGIPLRLHLGAEILCLEETVELARAGKLPTLADTRYVLCEFPFDAPIDYMDALLDQIAEAGYRPVIAHPERYYAIGREPGVIRYWFSRGYVIQVNKGSVLGAFGPDVRDTARWLLNRGLVHILASDAHSAHRRTTDLGGLRNWLLDRDFGHYARLLLEENPGRLLRGEDMAPWRKF